MFPCRFVQSTPPVSRSGRTIPSTSRLPPVPWENPGICAALAVCRYRTRSRQGTPRERVQCPATHRRHIRHASHPGAMMPREGDFLCGLVPSSYGPTVTVPAFVTVPEFVRSPATERVPVPLTFTGTEEPMFRPEDVATVPPVMLFWPVLENRRLA